MISKKSAQGTDGAAILYQQRKKSRHHAHLSPNFPFGGLTKGFENAQPQKKTQRWAQPCPGARVHGWSLADQTLLFPCTPVYGSQGPVFAATVALGHF